MGPRENGRSPILPIALFADIHANLEALQAVLADSDRLGISRIICLGDLVGYGPDPDKVVDLLMKRQALAVAGNHEIAVFSGSGGFNPLAQEAIHYTRDKLHPGWPARRGRRLRRWDYLKSIPETLRDGDMHFVHGSLRNPIEEYVYGPQDKAYDPQGVKDLFSRIRWICFSGHTHRPMVLSDDGGFWYPRESDETRAVAQGLKYIVNPGSVGQPRDGDARACYAVFDGRSLRYRRVEYDIEAVVRKIKRIGVHSQRLAPRLLLGI